MPKDLQSGLRLDDLSPAEIERIEALVFCLGGPAAELTPVMVWRASLRRAPGRGAPAFV